MDETEQCGSLAGSPCLDGRVAPIPTPLQTISKVPPVPRTWGPGRLRTSIGRKKPARSSRIDPGKRPCCRRSVPLSAGPTPPPLHVISPFPATFNAGIWTSSCTSCGPASIDYHKRLAPAALCSQDCPLSPRPQIAPSAVQLPPVTPYL
jgi:hypothetical protein